MNVSYDRDKHLIYLTNEEKHYSSGIRISINDLSNAQIVQLLDILEDWLSYNSN